MTMTSFARLAVTMAAAALWITPAHATALFTVVGGDTLVGYEVTATGGTLNPTIRIQLSAGSGKAPLHLTNFIFKEGDMAGIADDGTLYAWDLATFDGAPLAPGLEAHLAFGGQPIGPVSGLFVDGGAVALVGDNLLAYGDEDLLDGKPHEPSLALKLNGGAGLPFSEISDISVHDGVMAALGSSGQLFIYDLTADPNNDGILDPVFSPLLKGLAAGSHPVFTGVHLDGGVLALADGHTVLGYGKGLLDPGGALPIVSLELTDIDGAPIFGVGLEVAEGLFDIPPGLGLGGEPSGGVGGVPEPGTWALLLIGFGAIGAHLRRRGAAPEACA